MANDSGMKEYVRGETGAFRGGGEMAVSGQTLSHQGGKWSEVCARARASTCSCWFSIIRASVDQPAAVGHKPFIVFR